MLVKLTSRKENLMFLHLKHRQRLKNEQKYLLPIQLGHLVNSITKTYLYSFVLPF